MYCHRCRQELPDNARFCLRCGIPQREDVQVPMERQDAGEPSYLNTGSWGATSEDAALREAVDLVIYLRGQNAEVIATPMDTIQVKRARLSQETEEKIQRLTAQLVQVIRLGGSVLSHGERLIHGEHIPKSYNGPATITITNKRIIVVSNQTGEPLCNELLSKVKSVQYEHRFSSGHYLDVYADAFQGYAIYCTNKEQALKIQRSIMEARTGLH